MNEAGGAWALPAKLKDLMADSGGAGGYNINPSIADAFSNTPTQTVNAGTTIIFSSPGTDASQAATQTITPSTTAKADATAAGGNASSQDSGAVATGQPLGSSSTVAGIAGLSLLDWALIGLGGLLIFFIARKL